MFGFTDAVGYVAYLAEQLAEVRHSRPCGAQRWRRVLQVGQVEHEPCAKLVRLHAQLQRFEFVFEHDRHLDEFARDSLIEPPPHDLQVDISG
ncbi:hypothetical protein BST27_14275 [Mycobacterium intermedium]|uniref:Uncharacterized protein n=1 Tax=Mycobacterium intermedium TaxID=28445 RepID=A0A1E3S9K5_MYCIE|nr:hypothetical protein BHQ20_20325 [Mycobacterium intermedium]OPE49861.1 hypothetical protein BV508_12520 [Mycobacterium intermedium]ORB04688.1 hypothetical protein BST27_14275 [Mycobacterium intermedium]